MKEKLALHTPKQIPRSHSVAFGQWYLQSTVLQIIFIPSQNIIGLPSINNHVFYNWENVLS